MALLLSLIKRKTEACEPLLKLVVLDKNKRLTHSKICILDNFAILGSANFTESGLHHNFETILSFNKEFFVKKVADTFNAIEKNPEIDAVGLKEVAAHIWGKSKKEE